MHHGVTKLKLGKAGVAKIVEENLKKPGLHTCDSRLIFDHK